MLDFAPKSAYLAGMPQGSTIDADLLDDLTDKQRETLGLLAEGLTGKEIATRLDVSYSAASQRIENLRRKFGGVTKNEMERLARDVLQEPFADACIKHTGQKNHLPNSAFCFESEPRNQAADDLVFADSVALDATAPWHREAPTRLVPEVLDGEHAVPARWIYAVAAAVGMAVLMLVLLAVAEAIGSLV